MAFEIKSEISEVIPWEGNNKSDHGVKKFDPMRRKWRVY